jgi:hypothetical protein
MNESPQVVRVPVKAGDLILHTLMDDADAQRLEGRSLSLGSHGYAQMFWNGRVTLVHRWVLGLQCGDRRIGDHINGEHLDNRRANLRAVSASGSSQNKGAYTASRYRGVYPMPSGNWEVKIQFRGRKYRVGTFGTREAAAVAADAKRRELMPDYAGLRVALGRHGSPDRRTSSERRVRRAEAQKIRAWARSQGIRVADAGRLPGGVLNAYRKHLDALKGAA